MTRQVHCIVEVLRPCSVSPHHAAPPIVALQPVEVTLTADVLELSEGQHLILWVGRDPVDHGLCHAEEAGAEEAIVEAYHETEAAWARAEQISDDRTAPDVYAGVE